MKPFSLFFILSFLVLLSSCRKDESLAESSNLESDLQPRSRTSNPDFYDLKFVFDSLRLHSNGNGYITAVDDLITYYQARPSTRLIDFELKNIYPCWYCTQGDHFESDYYYTPLYDLATAEFKGAIITKSRAGDLSFAIITDDLAKSMALFDQELLPVYVNRVFEYFRGGTQGKKILDYIASKGSCFSKTVQMPDGYLGSACLCNTDIGELLCQGGDGTNCGGAVCPWSGGSGNDDPTGPGGGSGPTSTSSTYDDDGSETTNSGPPGTCYFCGLFGGGESGGGGGTSAPDSQFDYLERLDIVTQILEYIDENTNIYLHLGNQLALTNETHFDNTTYLLFQNMEYMSEGQINAYVQLITNHRHFITDDVMSQVLLFNDGLSLALNELLTTNNSSETSYRLGRLITILSQSYDWATLMNFAQPLMDLENQFTNLNLTDTEIEHILTFEPQLISDIGSFLSNAGQNTISISVIHDFLALQQCDEDPCFHTDYENEFEQILGFYNTMDPLNHDWLSTISSLLEENNIDMSIFEFMSIYENGCTNCSLSVFENESLEVLGLAGQDWIFDEAFWNNPDLTFQTQNLPSYQEFFDAFPKKQGGGWLYGADNIYGLLGGEVVQARNDYPAATNNTCALKVSIALNGSGISIPDIPGETLDGGDGKYYFLNTLALNAWMKKTFGEQPTNTNHLQFNIPEDAPLSGSLFGSNKGIYIMVANDPIDFEAKGHADIYTGTGCSWSCFFGAAKEINLWILE